MRISTGSLIEDRHGTPARLWSCQPVSKLCVFRLPSTIHFGEHAADLTGPEVKRIGGKSALVVTDSALVQAGTLKPVLDSLGNVEIDVTVYGEVTTEPTSTMVEDGLELLRDNSCDIVIGAGGGSALDAAKAIAAMATNPGRIQDYARPKMLASPPLNLIAIPTTAGTGSEATPVAVITDVERHWKVVIASSMIFPQVALVDPLLTLSMPRTVTAGTGIDALCHAIESYTSLKAQPMTDLMALSAVELLSHNLARAWSNPGDVSARTANMLGALQAGIAIANSSVSLIHGMTRPPASTHHAPHGLINGAVMAEAMQFSIIGNPERFARIAQAMGADVTGLSATRAAEEGVQMARQLVRDLEVPALSGFGITKAELDEIGVDWARAALSTGNPGNNPRVPTESEIVELYYRAL